MVQLQNNSIILDKRRPFVVSVHQIGKDGQATDSSPSSAAPIQSEVETEPRIDFSSPRRTYETLNEKLRIFLHLVFGEEWKGLVVDHLSVFNDEAHITKMSKHGITNGEMEQLRMAASYLREHAQAYTSAIESHAVRAAFTNGLSIETCDRHSAAVEKILERLRHEHAALETMNGIARAHDDVSSALAEFAQRIIGEEAREKPLSWKLGRVRMLLTGKGAGPEELLVLGHARNDEKILHEYLASGGTVSHEVNRAKDAASQHVHGLSTLGKKYGIFEDVEGISQAILHEGNRSAEDIEEEVYVLLDQLKEKHFISDERYTEEETKVRELRAEADKSKEPRRYALLRAVLLLERDRLRREFPRDERMSHTRITLIQTLNRIEAHEEREDEADSEETERVVEEKPVTITAPTVQVANKEKSRSSFSQVLRKPFSWFSRREKKQPAPKVGIKSDPFQAKEPEPVVMPEAEVPVKVPVEVHTEVSQPAEREIPIVVPEVTTEPEERPVSATAPSDPVLDGMHSGAISVNVLRPFVTHDGRWKSTYDALFEVGARGEKNIRALSDVAESFVRGLGISEERMYRVFANDKVRKHVTDYIQSAPLRIIGSGAKANLRQAVEELYKQSKELVELEKRQEK